MYTSLFSTERPDADDHELQNAFSEVTLASDKHIRATDPPAQPPKFWRSGSESIAPLAPPSFLPLGPITSQKPAAVHQPPINRQSGQALLPRSARIPDEPARLQHLHTYGVRGQMNINAPIYIPQYAQPESMAQHALLDPGPRILDPGTRAPDHTYDQTADYFTGNSVSSGSGYSAVSNAHTRDMNTANTSATAGSGVPGGYLGSRMAGPGKSTSQEEEMQKLRVELILKNQIIKNLTDQLSSISRTQARALAESGWAGSEPPPQTLQVPSNHYQLFIDLSQTLQNTTEELEDTKARLEAFVVAAALNPASAAIANGRYDEQEMTHRIVGKMAMLQHENEKLLTMMSYGNRTSLLVEIGVLRQELNALREQKRDNEQT